MTTLFENMKTNVGGLSVLVSEIRGMFNDRKGPEHSVFVLLKDGRQVKVTLKEAQTIKDTLQLVADHLNIKRVE